MCVCTAYIAEAIACSCKRFMILFVRCISSAVHLWATGFHVRFGRDWALGAVRIDLVQSNLVHDMAGCGIWDAYDPSSAHGDSSVHAPRSAPQNLIVPSHKNDCVMHAINMPRVLLRPSAVATCARTDRIHSHLPISAVRLNGSACDFTRFGVLSAHHRAARRPLLPAHFVTLHSIRVNFLGISISQSEFFHENNILHANSITRFRHFSHDSQICLLRV